ncbi:MAG: demethylmenaquinone methyltransferase/2-methoxy-6-polyprenyl-1,4-benzoquinol methylase [Candidatus Poriferisodalaceae bacterium]|jgi:demethylmenaquinone methyltransferase/2-methoxy-6-polyprenyl-1,4-benzoquinol methylase
MGVAIGWLLATGIGLIAWSLLLRSLAGATAIPARLGYTIALGADLWIATSIVLAIVAPGALTTFGRWLLVANLCACCWLRYGPVARRSATLRSRRRASTLRSVAHDSPLLKNDELLHGDDKAAAVEHMFDRVAPRYDAINRLMTFRLDVRWRRRTIRSLELPESSKVIDLACGTGDMCNDLAKEGLSAYGIDFSAGMLEHARTSAPLLRGDALRLPIGNARVDGVTCGFAMRNFTDLTDFFNELGRVVRPGGRIGLLDVAEPKSKILRLGHGVYFGKVVPMIGALLSDKAAYAYLPKSVAYLPEPAAMMDSLRAAGFGDATRTLLSGGITQMLLGTRDS